MKRRPCILSRYSRMLSFLFNNLGKVYCSKQEYERGIDLCQKAIEIDKKKPETASKTLHLRQLNMTTTFGLRGDTKAAWHQLNLARNIARHEFGSNTYYVAVYAPYFPNVLSRTTNLATNDSIGGVAKTLDCFIYNKRSWEKRKKRSGMPLTPARNKVPAPIQTGILHYRLAVTTLKQRRFEVSIPVLGGKGEMVRVARALAEALEQTALAGGDGSAETAAWKEEARRLGLAANDFRREIQGGGYDRFSRFDRNLRSHL
ncbi:uncharacterized protein A1O5_04389 [Cladophialophora psammophila CBS 110553]|uniref:Uncharacterized protein n=1 Tax=Cladophialophora psammophila CBS 110553 TaxID=1182543 RepID=W9WVE4_9EURO|nr:uncharacterized protein A1O5_04389 [Cladophialophora psammophila CBS 110553]EXJ71888.1 hypothetical protein A1O5_04389 [Cladophialophora psammophila CBS 110553]